MMKMSKFNDDEMPNQAQQRESDDNIVSQRVLWNRSYYFANSYLFISRHSGHDDHSDHEDEFSSFSAANEKLPWGQVIGATLLVNMATLSGVLIVVATAIHAKVLKRGGHDDASRSHLVGRGLLFDIGIPMFAVGALISTAVFLICISWGNALNWRWVGNLHRSKYVSQFYVWTLF